MTTALKAIFIPHVGNNYKPHAIKHYGLSLALLLIVAVQAIFNFQTTGSFRVLGYATNVSISDLTTHTNNERSTNGLTPLRINNTLSSAAQAKAEHMIANNYWAHDAPDGTTPWDFIAQTGYAYLTAGENLAYGFNTSAGAVTGWMNSPSHRANILLPDFEEVGFGIANGVYQGDENTVIVAIYGDPSTPVTATAPSQEQASAPPTPTAAPADVSPATPDAAPQQATPQEQPEESPEPAAPKVEEPKVFVATPLPPQHEFASAQNISNFDALLSGRAPWALYATTLIVMCIAAIYAYRHVLFIHKAVVQGEHFIVAHPMFEASIIYVLLWIMLASSYGAIQ